MPNNFYNQDNQTLINIAQTLVNVAGDDPKYALAPATTAALSGEATTLQELGLQYTQQEAILRGLTDQKLSIRTALISKLGQTAKSLEANPSISDSMLRTAALSARPAKGAKPEALFAPTGLAAEGFSDGTLALSWTPQNRTRVSYVVETSGDGQNWDYLATTQRRNLKVLGFAPGVPVYARVTAVNSTLSSPPSKVASIYAPAVPAAVQLKVA